MFRVTDTESIRMLVIDNPDRRNAIGPDGFAELRRLLDDFNSSEQRVLVITGAGEDFCSGLDLASGASFEGGVAALKAVMEETSGAAMSLFRSPKPTVAAVDGVAAGAGLNLAIGCDVVVASDRARFTEIFSRRGLVLDFGGTWLLPRLVGLARAKELALSGRVFDATEALQYGMIAEVVSPERLRERATEVARDLASGAPLAQRFIKRGLNRALEMSFEEAVAFETQAQSLLLTSEDAMEGFLSFLEKRDPDFRGK